MLDTDLSDDLEDVELHKDSYENNQNVDDGSRCDEISHSPNNASSDEIDNLDDLEDVDLDLMFSDGASNVKSDNDTLTFTISSTEESQSARNKTKRMFIPISKEERINRKLIHKLLLMSSMCHGAVRNKWCSDEKLMEFLGGTLPLQMVLMFHQDNEKTLDYVKARKFIDGLRTVVLVYAKKFKVSFVGLTRPDWKPAEVTQLMTERAVSLNRFRRLVRAFQGSRDIQAQGLVALLRSVGLNARLVFSIQVPDYKSRRPAVEESNKRKNQQLVKNEKERSEFDPVFIPNGRQAVLSGIRKKPSSEVSRKPAAPVSAKFPVFWAEVWNKYSKRWITVDPAVFKVVEVQPMRRKGKFEAPLSDENYQTWYVLAYDRRGVARDVTRRYTQYYNAKTVKKRIDYDSDDDHRWYVQALRSVTNKNAVVTEAEAYELKELRDRHICEGIPNNIADFKNHPVYALESQLRQDEVIYPNDDSSKCGTFRSSNKNSTIPIYKRSHVFRLKTPKAWHMKGRILKVGVRPLKTRKVKSGGLYAEGSADLDDEVRLYAEFQTDLFKPLPIIDGKIEKNVYGNVEIFTPTMIPENGYLAQVSPTVTIKMLERAAKYILKVDYAKAIASFDFVNSSKSKRTPTATESGILVDQQYKDALEVVLEALQEEEAEKKRNERELTALKYWSYFLKKLQIMRRLDKQHGSIDDDATGDQFEESDYEVTGAKSEEESDQESYFSVGSEGEDKDGDNFVPQSSRRRKHLEDSLDSGGFYVPPDI